MPEVNLDRATGLPMPPDCLVSQHKQPDWLDFVIDFIACEKRVCFQRRICLFLNIRQVGISQSLIQALIELNRAGVFMLDWALVPLN